jgi:hypothetical protein
MKKPKPLKSVPLKYSGQPIKDLRPEEEVGSQTDQLKEVFTNVGALAIRYHLGFSQRAFLLQQCCEYDFDRHSLNEPALGADEAALFYKPSKSTTHKDTMRLEEISHTTLGKGRFLNERGVRLKTPNKSDLRGEEYLWDSMHQVVWGIGRNVANALFAEGFMYVCCPLGISKQEYEIITEDLKYGAYDLILRGDSQMTVIKPYNSDIVLGTASLRNVKINIAPDATQQENGLTVDANGDEAEAGWIIHRPSYSSTRMNEIMVDPEDTEDLLRIMWIAKGGSHQLTEEQSAALLTGRMAITETSAISENRSLSLLFTIAEGLEQRFGFDSMRLLGSKKTSKATPLSVDQSHQRMRKLARETEVMEDFLTGALLNEMVVSLQKTKDSSTRKQFSEQFTHTYDSVRNTTNAVAYSYELTKKDGTKVLQGPTEELDPGLIDRRVGGQLQLPDLTNPRHAAALLSTGLIVAEQLLLEQILRGAYQGGEELIQLIELLGPESVDQLFQMIKELPSNENGPILGMQFPYCEPLLEQLRTQLGFKALGNVTVQLYEGLPISEEHAVVERGLEKLYQLGRLLQSSQTTNVSELGSRGINAGIILVIEKLKPDLYEKIAARKEVEPPILLNMTCKLPVGHYEAMGMDVEACPFLSRMKKGKTSAKKSRFEFFKPESEEENTPDSKIKGPTPSS